MVAQVGVIRFMAIVIWRLTALRNTVRLPRDPRVFTSRVETDATGGWTGLHLTLVDGSLSFTEPAALPFYRIYTSLICDFDNPPHLMSNLPALESDKQSMPPLLNHSGTFASP